MLFRVSFLSAVLVIANMAGADISASSKLVNKSRLLNDNEEEATWMAKYSLKFHKCYTISSYNREGQGGGEEANSPVSAQHIVHYRMCPSDSCSGGSSNCSGGGQYVVELPQFMEAYMEQEREVQEYNCQMAEDNCGCDNNDDDNCENKCFANQGLDYCIEDDDEFEIDEYLECREADFGNNNNNNAQYYIGPYCGARGSAIFLGVFTDAGCTEQASSRIYSKYNYGKELPYAQESMIDQHCTSCLQVDMDADDYGYNNDDADDEVIEMCEGLYEEAGKCEENLSSDDKYYRNSYSCNYIHYTLPKLAKASLDNGKPDASVVFAWLFGFTTIGLAATAYWLHTKVERSTVGLIADGADGAMA